MQVQDLLRLTKVWDLGRNDKGSNYLTLRGSPGSSDITSCYTGLHVVALCRVLLTSSSESFEATVNADKLQQTLRLFDSTDEVEVRSTQSRLVVSGAGKRVEIAKTPTTDELPQQWSADIDLDRSDFYRLIRSLVPVTGRNLTNYILTGINLTVQKNQTLGLKATNGSSTAAIASIAYAKEGENEAFGTATISATDLVTALGLMTRDRVYLGRHGSRTVLYDDEMYIEMGTLSGNYMSFANLPRRYSSVVSIPLADLRSACRAASILNPDRLIRVIGQRGGVEIRTVDSEDGRFVTTIVNEMDSTGLDLTLDSSVLSDVLSDLPGGVIELRYNDNKTPVLVKAQEQFIWLSPVIRQ